MTRNILLDMFRTLFRTTVSVVLTMWITSLPAQMPSDLQNSSNQYSESSVIHKNFKSKYKVSPIL